MFSTYVNFPANIGTCNVNKIAQLIALIGKREFPDENPEYVNQLLSLIKHKFILGITLLKATSDEIASTKPDVTSQQKKRFSQW